MRASERSVLTRARAGQWDSFCDWFWGHDNGLCESHCNRDRRRRIAAHLREEREIVPPVVEEFVPSA